MADVINAARVYLAALIVFAEVCEWAVVRYQGPFRILEPFAGMLAIWYQSTDSTRRFILEYYDWAYKVAKCLAAVQAGVCAVSMVAEMPMNGAAATQ
ncbi:hypothetical protein LTR91_011882 [Friedmanniomyces endolithicus]|uniref:Uncharacterized protein n=1 Tax=Friedmanniomyces endolithicus TaxID=329885 RepID=A0AAN6KGT6_9PEZI|nr:hypothetical protein LTR59_012057 [Friedmanniomyces endolithicus]KAK0789573.1 hypothetical protein LTR38_010889 [Friedmanniomyces endolithicus]KAK0868398.1 hypothetical protein LTR87_014177 [Friedmanniomyces endolithicus]KAK0897281.1 hypothetical protein LTR02_010773 [Friedmanniomyces endolithicus]KAK0941557.1 hypothetical protein LTR29_006936 [Friedmanniomyces endolithicus]